MSGRNTRVCMEAANNWKNRSRSIGGGYESHFLGKRSRRVSGIRNRRGVMGSIPEVCVLSGRGIHGTCPREGGLPWIEDHRRTMKKRERGSSQVLGETDEKTHLKKPCHDDPRRGEKNTAEGSSTEIISREKTNARESQRESASGNRKTWERRTT